MGNREDFVKAWQARFSDPPPVLDCFEADATGKLDSNKLSKCYSECQFRIKQLEKELHEQQFISNIIWQLTRDEGNTEGIQPGSVLGSPVLIPKGVTTETDLDLVLAGNDTVMSDSLDQDIPLHNVGDGLSPDKDTPAAPFYSYATLPYCEDKRVTHDPRMGTANISKNQEALTVPISGQEGSAIQGRQSGPKYYEVESEHPKQMTEITHSGLSVRSRLKTLEPPATKEKPKFPVGSFKKSESIKRPSMDENSGSFESGSNPHSGTAGDRSSTISVGKPKPVPAPRPSVKGPSTSRSSTSSECNVAVVAPFKNDLNSDGVNQAPALPQRQLSGQASIESQGPDDTNDGQAAREKKNFRGPLALPPGARYKKQHNYEEIDIGPSPGIGNGKVPSFSRSFKGNGPAESAPLPTFRQAKPGTVSTASAEPSATVTSPAFTTFGKFTPLSSPQVRDNAQPSLNSKAGTENQAIYDEPYVGSKGLKDNLHSSSTSKECEYQEPIAVHRIESVDEGSSSDEEPMYYNLLLMKQNTLNRKTSVDTLGSSDGQKRVEQKARRLSQRFSQSLDPALMSNITSKGKLPKLGSVGEDVKVSEGSRESHPNAAGNQPEDGPVWKKRESMLRATDNAETDSISSTCSDGDELDMEVPFRGDPEQQIRRWVVNSILESEKNYVDILDILMQYMQTFKNVVGTPQSVISKEDIGVIFYQVPELHHIHYKFIRSLEPRMENWTDEQSVAEPFKVLTLEECNTASEYLKNYHRAVSTVERCTNESPQFGELTKEITCKGFTDKPSLVELLHKPVVRFQRNTLVLHDLIKCTSATHPDYDMLQKTLKITTNFLESFQNPKERDTSENQRYLSKQGLLVEVIGNSKPLRKLRQIFLFNDVLVCAKQKLNNKKISHEVKWYISVADMVLADTKCALDEKKKAELEALQHRVSDLQAELKGELRKARMAHEGQVGVFQFQRTWSFRGHSRNLERIKKKLLEEEGKLLLLSPHLGFRLKSCRHQKAFTLLIASDYERMSWRDTIDGLKNKVSSQQTNFANIDLNFLINAQKQPKVTTLNAMLEKEDFGLGEEDCLFGVLTVTIHKLNGLKTKCNTYCCVEVDSFGHFFMKAKTNVAVNSMEPFWNEAFDIDLEGSQTLRLLCYKETKGDDPPILLGKCALELSKAWLRGDFKESSVSLNEEMSIAVSLNYASREQTLKRAPSAITGGLFGVKLWKVTKREGTSIPLIVTTCVQEVEKRGINDVGIYRISGLSAEIQKMRKAFEKSSRGAAEHAKTSDVNVLTGLLKLYFRELPEAVFTDALYPNLVTAMSLSDPEGKENTMLSLVRSLPEPHHSTVVYMLDHLVVISHNEVQNKMSLQNLATVFGPTLLRPATKEAEPQSMEAMFSAGARDAMMQTGILLYLLNLKVKGADFDTEHKRRKLANLLALPEENF